MLKKTKIKINSDLIDNNKTMINYRYDFNVRDITDMNKLEMFKDKIVIIGVFTKKEGLPFTMMRYISPPSNKYYLGKWFSKHVWW